MNPPAAVGFHCRALPRHHYFLESQPSLTTCYHGSQLNSLEHPTVCTHSSEDRHAIVPGSAAIALCVLVQAIAHVLPAALGHDGLSSHLVHEHSYW
jgi:hypothetical protein